MFSRNFHETGNITAMTTTLKSVLRPSPGNTIKFHRSKNYIKNPFSFDRVGWVYVLYHGKVVFNVKLNLMSHK